MGFPCKVCSSIDSVLTSTKLFPVHIVHPSQRTTHVSTIILYIHVIPTQRQYFIITLRQPLNSPASQQSSKSEQVSTNAALVLHHYTQPASQFPSVSTNIKVSSKMCTSQYQHNVNATSPAIPIYTLLIQVGN